MLRERPRSRWLHWFEPRPDAPVRLFCLPYAGGSGHVFREWAAHVPAGVELCGVSPPGRGLWLGGPAQRDLLELTRSLAAEIEPLLDRPYALFGHSMGALVAFELVREQRRAGGLLPAVLFASALRPPHLPPLDPIYDLPDDEFVERLRELEGTPDEVLDNPRLLRVVMPTLRADFEACGRYRYRPEPPIDVPIVALGGRDDPHARPDELEHWRRETAASVRIEILPGGHLFLLQQRDALIRLLAAELEPLVSRLSAPRSRARGV